MKTAPEAQFIDVIECSQENVAFEVRKFINSRTQFAVAFNADGSATISSPQTGHRNPATPQPQPPQQLAMAA